VDYEAQAAIELEGFAIDQPDTWDGYEFALTRNRPPVPHPFSQSYREKGWETTQSDRPTVISSTRAGKISELPEEIREERDPMRINVAPMWTALLADLQSGVNKTRMAARFHSGVARTFVEVAKAARDATGITVVGMSGGVMHNRRLTRLLRTGLEAEGFAVYQHRCVSPGDGGLSYGQAAAAAATLTKRS
jgi:hydrogenase maturation protein HypF